MSSEPTKSYWVERVFSCLHCGGSGGSHWHVIGPDDVPGGRDYEDQSDAEEAAMELNEAYERGRQSAEVLSDGE